MNDSKLTVGVVIPTFNRREYLRTLLNQIKAQILKDIKLFIVVVVDGSTDGTLEMLARDFPDVFIVKGFGDWWYTKSINMGIKKALQLKTDFILALNDDIELDDNYLSNILNASLSLNQSCIMGSISVTADKQKRITFSGVKKIIWWRAKSLKYHSAMTPYGSGNLTGIHKSQVLPGRGMLISKTIIEAIGLFEEKLPQYGSDDEYCLRAAKKGYEVFICWDALLFSHYKLTAASTAFMKPSLTKFAKSFFNKYSKNFWYKTAFIHWHYGKRIMLPLTMIIIILAHVNSLLKYRVQAND